jgi:hypothetical protein
VRRDLEAAAMVDQVIMLLVTRPVTVVSGLIMTVIAVMAVVLTFCRSDDGDREGEASPTPRWSCVLDVPICGLVFATSTPELPGQLLIRCLR